MIQQIQHLPFFVNDPISSCLPMPEQGNANRTYLVITAQKKHYLLRHFQITLDRGMEFCIQTRVARATLAPMPRWLDTERGLMLSDFVHGVHHHRLTPRQLRQIAQRLKKLHALKIRAKRNTFRENFSFRDSKVLQAFSRLKRRPMHYALGHNDLHQKNILFTKKGVQFIDWEYARYSDIYFDLITIIIEFKLKKREQKIFLRYYFSPKSADPQKLNAFAIIYHRLWEIWFKKLEKNLL